MSKLNYQEGYELLTTLVDHATKVYIYHKKMRTLHVALRDEINPLNSIALAEQMKKARNAWLEHMNLYTETRDKFDKYVGCNNVFILDRLDNLVAEYCDERK